MMHQLLAISTNTRLRLGLKEPATTVCFAAVQVTKKKRFKLTNLASRTQEGVFKAPVSR
jgi:hypothetical protein